MSTTMTTSPRILGLHSTAAFFRLTVDQYRQMIANGILTEVDAVELIEGCLVRKEPRGPEHDYAIRTLHKRLARLVPDTFTLSNQCATTINDSEPEPDFTVARGDETLYRDRHPGPADTALVIEVSASSLYYDRTDKARVYARAGVPVYWVVNVIDKVIEVYTKPSGPTDAPEFAQRDVYPVGTAVPIVLDGTAVGTVPVADVMS